MKFTTTLLSLVGLVAAAPAPQIPASGAVITPSAVSDYSVWTGAIAYNTGNGKIFKNGKTTDVTTLFTFTYPGASAGKTCTFHLYLSPASTLTGAKAFDIFSSLQPATKSTTTWPPGNQRNIQLARLSAVLGGEATYLAGYPQVAKSYPCPSGTVGYEFVPTDDTTDIEWTQGAGVGAYITYA
jgi:Ubiquitin 3 binding protein But2 C-terminal domain